MNAHDDTHTRLLYVNWCHVMSRLHQHTKTWRLLPCGIHLTKVGGVGHHVRTCIDVGYPRGFPTKGPKVILKRWGETKAKGTEGWTICNLHLNPQKYIIYLYINNYQQLYSYIVTLTYIHHVHDCMVRKSTHLLQSVPPVALDNHVQLLQSFWGQLLVLFRSFCSKSRHCRINSSEQQRCKHDWDTKSCTSLGLEGKLGTIIVSTIPL